MSGAAAFAAAAGYPVGTMVYYAGGYRCTDLHEVRHLVDVLRIAARHGLQTVEVLEHAIPELHMGPMSNYFLLRKPNER